MGNFTEYTTYIIGGLKYLQYYNHNYIVVLLLWPFLFLAFTVYTPRPDQV